VEAVPRNPEPLRAIIRAGKGRHVRQAGRRSTRIVLGILLCVPTGVGLANAKADTKSVEDAVLALSPQVALLTAEGDSVVTTAAGDTFPAPFAQTVVFVLKGGGWKGIHAHQSSPRVR